MPKRTSKKEHRMSDTQLVILSTAAHRDDLKIHPLPDALKAKGATLTRAINALIGKGLILERPVSARDDHWRSNENGQPVTLVISEADLDLLGLESKASEKPSNGLEPTSSATRSVRANAKVGKKKPTNSAKQAAETKGATIQRLLRRKHGASISDLADATGWQAHSVRGFLSGTLKKKQGLNIICNKTERGIRTYRIAS